MSLPNCKVAFPRPLIVGDFEALRKAVGPELALSQLLDDALIRGLAHETLNGKQVHFVCSSREVSSGQLVPGTYPCRDYPLLTDAEFAAGIPEWRKA